MKFRLLNGIEVGASCPSFCVFCYYFGCSQQVVGRNELPCIAFFCVLLKELWLIRSLRVTYLMNEIAQLIEIFPTALADE